MIPHFQTPNPKHKALNPKLRLADEKEPEDIGGVGEQGVPHEQAEQHAPDASLAVHACMTSHLRVTSLHLTSLSIWPALLLPLVTVVVDSTILITGSRNPRSDAGKKGAAPFQQPPSSLA